MTMDLKEMLLYIQTKGHDIKDGNEINTEKFITVVKGILGFTIHEIDGQLTFYKKF